MGCIHVLWRDTLQSPTSHYQSVHLPQIWLKATYRVHLSLPLCLSSTASDTLKSEYDAHAYKYTQTLTFVITVITKRNEVIFLLANNRLSKKQINLLLPAMRNRPYFSDLNSYFCERALKSRADLCANIAKMAVLTPTVCWVNFVSAFALTQPLHTFVSVMTWFAMFWHTAHPPGVYFKHFKVQPNMMVECCCRVNDDAPRVRVSEVTLQLYHIF